MINISVLALMACLTVISELTLLDLLHLNLLNNNRCRLIAIGIMLL